MKKTSHQMITAKLGVSLTILALALVCWPAPHSSAWSTQDNRQLQRDSSQSNPASERRIALVIGNGAYTNAPPLKNPPNDATLVSATLKRLGFEVSAGTNKSQREMKQLIRDFGQRLRAGGGVGLFYFAGHGVQSKGHNYLIPIDADIQNEADVEDVGVDVNYVLNMMDDAQSALNIVILDACRNNPFARSFRSTQGGLAQVKAPTGTLIAYATAPDSTAADGERANSPYTEALTKQMETPGVVLETMFRRVTEQVSARTLGRQEPWVSDNHKGEFFFNNTTGVSGATRAGDLETNTSSAEQVLEKYFHAIGGETAIHSLRSLSRSGEFEITVNGNRLTGTISDIWKAPNKSYIEGRLSGGELSEEAFDGTTGWLKGSFGFAQMTGQQLEIKKRTSTIGTLASVAEFKMLYPTITFKGKETLNDKEAYVIEAKPAVGKPDLFYFSLETGLLVRLNYFSESSSLKGVMIPTQLYFDDYVEINGAMIPFVFREVRPGFVAITRFSAHATRFNISIDDTKFQPPKNTGRTVDDSLRAFEQARNFIDKAAEQVAVKNYDEALLLCNQAIVAGPNYPDAYNQRGFIYGLKGQFENAIADYSMAIKLNPYNSLHYYNRGIAYYKKNEFDSAIEDLNKAIEMSPGKENFYSVVARLFWSKANSIRP